MKADRVVEIERERRRVTAVKTASGNRISSAWFIDASGANASLFPRAFQLPAYDYGPRKVAMWAYFNVPDSREGTTLYMDGQPPYMEWIWEIPIHSSVISVSYVAAGDAIEDKRKQGSAWRKFSANGWPGYRAFRNCSRCAARPRRT